MGEEAQARCFFYDLLLSMTVREPSDTIVAAWRRGLEAVRATIPDSELGRAADRLVRLLATAGAGDRVRAEFNRLFCDPLGPTVSLLASHYADGRPFGPYLVRLRAFLKNTPFEKDEAYAEPEDSLPFHLDLMRCLIGEEMVATSPEQRERWHGLQRDLVCVHLAAWLPACIAELRQREAEPFYREAAALMQAFFVEEQAGLGGEPLFPAENHSPTVPSARSAASTAPGSP